MRPKGLWEQLDNFASVRRKRANANRATPPRSQTPSDTLRSWLGRHKRTSTAGPVRSGSTPLETSAEDDRGRSREPVPAPTAQPGTSETIQNALLQTEAQRKNILRHCKQVSDHFGGLYFIQNLDHYFLYSQLIYLHIVSNFG